MKSESCAQGVGVSHASPFENETFAASSPGSAAKEVAKTCVKEAF